MTRYWLVACVLALTAFDASAQCASQVLSHPEVVNQVVIEGDVAFLASPRDSEVAHNAGAVHVYSETPAGWVFQQTLRSSLAIPDEEFGTTLEVNGNWAAITTRPGSPNPSQVLYYERTSNGWVERQIVDLPPGQHIEVDLRGDLAAYGFRDAQGLGHAQLLKNQAGVWVATTVLTPHVPVGPVRGVALTDDSIWVVAAGQAGGAAFVFERVPTQPGQPASWEQTGRFHASSPDSDQFYYGIDVHSDSTTVVIGSWFDVGFNGAAYVYERVAGTWRETGHLVSPISPWDLAGTSVFVNGDTILVSESYREQAEVWRRTSAGWTFDNQVVPPVEDVGFGLGAALTGDNQRMLVAATETVAEYPVDAGVHISSFCQSRINSTGASGSMAHGGSTSIATNDFTLRTRFAGVNATGIFFYGDESIQVPFGDGFRCVGGHTTRILPPVTTSAMGTVVRTIDLTAHPFNAGRGHITPGSTWNFQFWFRDQTANSISEFNTTDALQVTFCP